MSRHFFGGITRGRMVILSIFVVTLLAGVAAGLTVSSGVGSADHALNNQDEVTRLQGQVQTLQDEVQTLQDQVETHHNGILQQMTKQHASLADVLNKSGP